VGPSPVWAAKVLAPQRYGAAPRLRYRDEYNPTLTVTELSGGKFFELAYGDGTRFLLDESASRIWGEPGPGLSQDDVWVYLLGPVMGFVLRRHGRLALHASALIIGGSAIAISGEAGYGKSTTAAALALRGHPVFCEDICALQDLYAKKHVMPGYPRISLWPEAVSHLFSSADALPLIVAGWEKRYLALDGKLASFAEHPKPLCRIYLLAARSEEPAAPFIERLSPRQAALAIVQNTYMNYLLTKEQRAAEFYAVAKLVSEVECCRITPHADPARLGQLASLIEFHATNVISGLESSAAPHGAR
jgi:hypothetical protein